VALVPELRLEPELEQEPEPWLPLPRQLVTELSLTRAPVAQTPAPSR